MQTGNKLIRWIAVLAAVVLLAAACGDDGGSSETSPGDDTATSDDTGTGDDTPTDDTATDDPATDDPATDDPPTVSTVNCAEIEAALEAAGDFAAVDPTGGSASDNLEASFAESRASLAALGATAPEIADEVEQALEGLDVIGAALAELDWNTDFSTNPSAALELVTVMSNTDVMGMATAMASISAWISTSCTS